MKSQGTPFGSRRPSAFEPTGFDVIFGKHPSFDFALHAVGQFRPLAPKERAGEAAVVNGQRRLFEWVDREISRFIDVQQSEVAPLFQHLVEQKR